MLYKWPIKVPIVCVQGLWASNLLHCTGLLPSLEVVLFLDKLYFNYYSHVSVQFLVLRPGNLGGSLSNLNDQYQCYITCWVTDWSPVGLLSYSLPLLDMRDLQHSQNQQCLVSLCQALKGHMRSVCRNFEMTNFWVSAYMDGTNSQLTLTLDHLKVDFKLLRSITTSTREWKYGCIDINIAASRNFSPIAIPVFILLLIVFCWVLWVFFLCGSCPKYLCWE